MRAENATEQQLPDGYASGAAPDTLGVPSVHSGRPEGAKTVLRERFFGDAARKMALSRIPGGSGLPCDTVGAVDIVEVWSCSDPGPQPCDLRFYNRGGVLLGFFPI